MLALHRTPSRAVTVTLERKCEYLSRCHPIATQLTLLSHCVDADRTYDVSLTLESEDEHAHTDEEDHDHANESATEMVADADHEIKLQIVTRIRTYSTAWPGARSGKSPLMSTLVMHQIPTVAAMRTEKTNCTLP
jgi:hypothetical protein